MPEEPLADLHCLTYSKYSLLAFIEVYKVMLVSSGYSCCLVLVKNMTEIGCVSDVKHLC